MFPDQDVPDRPPVAAGEVASIVIQPPESKDIKAGPVELPSFKGFEEERRAFDFHKTELLREHQGQHVVIQGHTIIGIGMTYEDALEIGYARFGLGSFYVKEILPEDPVLCVTRVVLPCSN